MTNEHVRASRKVREEAHKLHNACASFVGGVQMALSLAFAEAKDEPEHKVVPHPVKEK